MSWNDLNYHTSSFLRVSFSLFFSPFLYPIFRFLHFSLLFFTHFSLCLAPVLSLSWICFVYILKSLWARLFGLEWYHLEHILEISWCNKFNAHFSLSVSWDSMLNSHERFENPVALAKLMNLFFLVIDPPESSAVAQQAYFPMWLTTRSRLSNVEGIRFSLLSHSHFFFYTRDIYPSEHLWF